MLVNGLPWKATNCWRLAPTLVAVLKEAREKGIEVPFIDAVRAKKYQGVIMFRRWN
jgi:hypothetical protein